MNKSGILKPLKNSENHECFACSQINPYGLQMKLFSDDKALFSWLTVPSHLCGWDNVVHGGVVATILDEIMGRAAIYFSKKFALTYTMSVEYHKPVPIGEQIQAQGRVLEVRGKREIIVEGHIYKGQKTLCAKGVGTFKLYSAQAIAKLGIMGEETIKKFDFLIEP